MRYIRVTNPDYETFIIRVLREYIDRGGQPNWTGRAIVYNDLGGRGMKGIFAGFSEDKVEDLGDFKVQFEVLWTLYTND